MNWLHEFWACNKESIILAIVIAAITGPVWAFGHEVTKNLMRKWAARK